NSFRYHVVGLFYCLSFENSRCCATFHVLPFKLHSLCIINHILSPESHSLKLLLVVVTSIFPNTFLPLLEARTDVPTQTPWKAPIMWEGMFDGTLYDKAHLEANSSVALTVFAIAKFCHFLVSLVRYKHFMIGIPVTYYIFTDIPEDIPDFVLGPERTMKVLYVPRHARWQDISMMRMKTLSKIIDLEISYTYPYIFCLDVDSIFENRFGTEALGESVAVLHSHYYTVKQDEFTYDRNPKSKAYMKTGDYYYHAALFGDKKNNVEALWHDESHLNKYYWLHKPTKLLSPEYCWDDSFYPTIITTLNKHTRT
uniref:Uncharacterized protein n=1 Tax=Periophthalmus magnuspinnatus TaxID=409849 RepID=A0A3B4AIF9_9GOBI